jgi:hypothetical protein
VKGIGMGIGSYGSEIRLHADVLFIENKTLLDVYDTAQDKKHSLRNTMELESEAITS